LTVGVAYVAIGILVYWAFYAYHPYNEDTGSGATAFKVWFVVALVAHHVLTLVAASLLSYVLRLSRPVMLATSVVVMLLFSLPTLGGLAGMNDCQGISYPWHSDCITQEGE
jgi:hypothetical protein